MTNASKKESKQLTNKYSPSEFVKNVYSLAMTKITMPQARFVRRPIFLRGGGGDHSREQKALQPAACAVSTWMDIRKH